MTGRILLVDDDAPFRDRLARSLERRDYQTRCASDSASALAAAAEFQPGYVLLDLRLGGESGLHLLPRLRSLLPTARIVVLTGYGSIATALEAVRSGASDYRTKPTDVERIEAALHGISEDAPLEAPSLDRVEWEHLHRVLSDCGGNISQASRVLGIDRRSLQRKLARFPPPR